MDGEGCFIISISKDQKNKIGWRVQLFFQIGIHEKDQALLESIKNYWGVGSIRQEEQMLQYRASSKQDLKVIINHFDNFTLRTEKLADFLLFKHAYNLFINQEHLTVEGFKKIIALKLSSNRCRINPELEKVFTNITPVKRPDVKNKQIADPN